MRIGSLCSGAGGLDMAVEAVFGAQTVWHAETDPAASKVLDARWPGVTNIGDITGIDWDAVEPVDILTAGYPCQPFSAAGRRKGTNDERHLWPYVREAIRRIRPRFTILENVAGHRSLGLDRVLGDLAEDGMHVWWCSLRAADVGSCHGRERLWILVTPDAARDGRPRLNGGPSGTPTRSGRERRPTRSDGRPAGPVDLLPTPAASRSGRNQSPSPGAAIRPSLGNITDLLPTPTSRDHKGHNQRGDDSCLTGALLPTPEAKNAHAGPDYARMNRQGSGGHDLDLVTAIAYDDLDSSRWGKYEAAVRRWESLTRPAPSPTEPNTKGNPRLHPAFSEWMMGWPAGWVTDIDISRNDQLRIIGNGVVPQCAASALCRLLTLCEVAA